MWENLKVLCIKMFWPLIIGYGLYILYQIYSYYNDMKLVVDKEFFKDLYITKFIGVGLIIALAVLFKLWGKTKVASLILGVPAIITITFTLLTILIWVFLAVVMIAFGK